MNATRRRALRAQHEAAGPLTALVLVEGAERYVAVLQERDDGGGDDLVAKVRVVATRRRDPIAAMIAGAVNALPALLDALDAAERARDESSAEVERLRERVAWYRAAHTLIAEESVWLRSPAEGCVSAEEDGDGPAILVNVNDVFAWGCADAESMRYADAPELLRRQREEGWPGVVRWVQEQREKVGERAELQPPVQARALTMDALRTENERLRAELHRLGKLAEGAEGRR